MNNFCYNHVTRIPISTGAYSFKRTPKRLLSHPSDQHFDGITSQTRRSSDSVTINRKNKLGEFAHSIREHVKLGPKLAETVKRKLSLGARILRQGGVENVFKQNFNVKEEEKLLKAFQCHLSTTAGPIAGLLFISTDKVAFCSERSIKILSPSGKCLKIRYKVVIPLRKIMRANASANINKPSQKYIQVVTEDNFEFWFMGFLNLQTTLRCLQQTMVGGL